MATGTVESAVAVRVEENRDTEKSVDREKVSFSSNIKNNFLVSFLFWLFNNLLLTDLPVVTSSVLRHGTTSQPR